MTLIEVMIYSVMLALLISGFINYSFNLHIGDLDLIHKINAEVSE